MSDCLKACATAWLAQHKPAMLVQVGQTRGSVPREAGTRMLVAADAVAGTIGGGHLELKAIAQARLLLAQWAATASGRPPAPQQQHYPLGPALGQCCGGALTLHTAALDEAALQAWPDEAPLFTLQLYGAGHVGRAIARLLDDLPCRVLWIDQRDSEFPAAASAPHIQRVGVAPSDPIEAEVAQAPAGCFYLVLTHSHALDLAITGAILRRADVGWLGLIGSATKRARFVHRFEQQGFSAAALARLHCPIGLPGIRGKQPALIALAVVAQLLQVAGASGA